MEIDINFGGLADAVRRMRELEQATAGVARQAQAAAAAGFGPGTGRGGGGVRPRPPDTFARRLTQLISTTRFGAGGVMPLVGRVAALGGAEMAGPIGMAIAAVSAFTHVMNSATQSVGEFNRAATMTGGTAAQTAGIAALGIRPGEQAAAAAGLRQALSSDPLAIMLSQRSLGIGQQMPRGYGQVNEAVLLQNFLKGLREMIKTGREAEALELARAAGMEQYIDRLKVSNQLFKEQIRDAGMTTQLMEQNSAAMREFQGEAGRVSSAFDDLKNSIAGQMAPEASKMAGDVADAIRAIIRFREAQLDWIKGLPDWAKKLFGAPNLGEKSDPQDATQKNTEAINENTRAMKQGVLAGGPLTKGAVPEGIRGQLMDEQLKGAGLNLGVFGN